MAPEDQASPVPPRPRAYRQREALIEAMVEAVSRHGYAGVTIAELLKLAGVSKRAFYERFEDKRDVFLAAHDAFAERGAERLTQAFLRPGDLRERLLAAHREADELLIRHPAESSLVIVDSLTLGAAGVAARERALAGFEAMLRHAFSLEGPGEEVSARTVRAIVVGTCAVWQRHLRRGGKADRPEHAGALVEWAMSYGAADDDGLSLAIQAAGEPRSPAHGAGDGRLGWDEPPGSPVGRAVLGSRERISRATARLVVEDGFEAISIPAISAEAGTSNATFYENFGDKREALLVAFEALLGEALAAASKAMDESGSQAEGRGAAIRALLEHIAAHDVFARLAFLQLPTGGRPVFDRGEAALDEFAALLFPIAAGETAEDGDAELLRTAVAGGLWAVIQHEIVRRRAWALPGLAPEIARIALKPLPLTVPG